MKTLFPVLLSVMSLTARAQTEPVTPPQPEPEPRFNLTEDMGRLKSAPAAPAASAIPELSGEQLLQQPELLRRALTSSVILRNKPAVRQVLPLFLRLPEDQRGEEPALLADMARALLDEDEERYTAAAAIYRRLLDEEPDRALVRLFLAQNLAANRRDGEAEQELRYLIEQMPDAEGSPLPSYRRALQERRKWQFYGGVNYVRDRNVNNARKQSTIATSRGQWTLPKAESAEGLAYRAGASRDWYVKNGFFVRTHADLDGKFFWNNHRYDDVSLRVGAGVVYRNSRSESALLPYAERRWYGTDKYAREIGARAETSYRLTPRHRLLAAAEYGRERYDTRHFLNGPRANLSLSWLWAFSPRGYVVLGSDASQKKARDGDDSYRRYALRAAWTHYWQNGLQTGLSFNAGVRRYRGEDLLHIRRRDHEYAASGSLAHDKVQWWGVQPRLVMQWQKSRSNHPFYGYEKINAFMQLNKGF